MVKKWFQDSVDNCKETCKDLKNIGIRARLVHNRYSANNEFTLSLSDNRKVLHFNLETTRDTLENHKPAIVNVLGVSKKFHQAVVVVEESSRTFIKNVAVWHRADRAPSRKNIINQFNIALPSDTKYNIKFVDKDYDYANSNREQCDWKYKITATAPATKLYFLVGYDEEHLFVSMLPEPAITVADAHRILLPEELKGKSNYFRQGEFFFVPITKNEEELVAHGSHSRHTYTNLMKDDRASDHKATLVITVRHKTEDWQFATGYVGNGRHSLFLNGWYRVLVNREQPSPNNSNKWD